MTDQWSTSKLQWSSAGIDSAALWRSCDGEANKCATFQIRATDQDVGKEREAEKNKKRAAILVFKDWQAIALVLATPAHFTLKD